jgi:excisionase family DNA binding protein
MAEIDTEQAIETVFRLWRAQRAMADDPLREDIEEARRFVTNLVGRTVTPAVAARMLGVSRPALKRWLDRGEIATVMTPGGRREIPLRELLSLMDEVRSAPSTERPLAAVIRARHRRAQESIDLDRLLPSDRQRNHRVAELQGLAYHRLVAERLDDEMVRQARQRVDQWRRANRIKSRWADAWDSALAMPLDDLAKLLSADTPESRELRQTSPFAGVLNEQERRRLVQAVEARGS